MVSQTSEHRLRDRFRGALLGTMVGDALGMPVEGFARHEIRMLFGTVRTMLPLGLGRGCYTDDTQMMIGLAEALLDAPGRVDAGRVAARFGENFDPERGYGGNTEKILEAFREGTPWREAVRAHGYPGGSFANGAAMRVAPVALAFHPDSDAVAGAAEAQAEVTGHVHCAGRFGARVQALAVHRALVRGTEGRSFDGEDFAAGLLGEGSLRFDEALDWVVCNVSVDLETAAAVFTAGGSRAVSTVPAALWAFLSRPDDPEEAISRAVSMGGDADTVGAMAGAVAGAYHGAERLPQAWMEALENGEKGRDYVLGLADRLFRIQGAYSAL